MIHLNFYDLLSKLTYIPPNIQNYFNDIILEADQLNIDLLWDKIIERFKLLFPLYKTEEVNAFKLDILLSLYTSARFTTAEAIDTGEIAKAYIEYDPASTIALLWLSMFIAKTSRRKNCAIISS